MADDLDRMVRTMVPTRELDAKDWYDVEQACSLVEAGLRRVEGIFGIGHTGEAQSLLAGIMLMGVQDMRRLFSLTPDEIRDELIAVYLEGAAAHADDRPEYDA